MANPYGAVELGNAESHPQGNTAASPAATESLIPEPFIKDVTEATFDEMVALSMKVPIVLDLWATWCQPCKQLTPVLEELAHEYAGRFQLAKIDIDANPTVAQAFQVQSVPSVFVMVGGRPMSLFQGVQPKEQIRQVLDQVLELAAKSGASGRLSGNGADTPTPEPISEEQQQINDLLEAGDFAGAEKALEKAIELNPSDEDYKAQLAQVRLQSRLNETDEGVMAKADRLIASGEDAAAFTLLLDAFEETTGEEREPLRERIVELFRLSANKDAVNDARTRLATLMF